MKRRKRKKVTAMGLAVVMAATVPMQVFATEGVEENTQVNEQVNEQADVTGSAVGEQTEGFSFNLSYDRNSSGYRLYRSGHSNCNSCTDGKRGNYL